MHKVALFSSDLSGLNFFLQFKTRSVCRWSGPGFLHSAALRTRHVLGAALLLTCKSAAYFTSIAHTKDPLEHKLLLILLN